MKLNQIIIVMIILAVILNIFSYPLFELLLSITWCITSILIIYSALINTFRYKGIQLNIKKIFKSLKSKSKNNISPISSLCISLAGKIGVGSLSGVALAIYFGGVGVIFWLVIISLLISINTYVECILGIKYRDKIDNNFYGGPSFYIKKCLNNKKLSYLYSVILIITYSILFLSIQSNTIVTSVSYFNIDTIYIVIFLIIITLIIISSGVKGISLVNSFLVPIMLSFYLFLGIFLFVKNIDLIPGILLDIKSSAFNIKSIISVFLIGMQRAIFITESSLGTSAISSSSTDNDGNSQGLLEVLGIYIVIFIVCLTTFIIIVTSDYQQINFNNINGIEIIMYAFRYHFGYAGNIFLTVITILFAFSTIISSYFFGESNLKLITKSKIISLIFKIVFILIIYFSSFLKPSILWNLTDYFIALLAIINVFSILKIIKRYK